MRKRLRKKLGRSPVPPPTKVFTDRKKEGRRKRCRREPGRSEGAD